MRGKLLNFDNTIDETELAHMTLIQIKLELAFTQHGSAHFVISLFPLAFFARVFHLRTSHYHKSIDAPIVAAIVRVAAVVCQRGTFFPW